MRVLHTDVACTVCGCVCDDLTAVVEDGRLSEVGGACALAEPWFADLRRAEATPIAGTLVRGEEVPFPEGVRAAAEILRAARAPLVWGLSRSSTAGQRAAVRLAETVGATIDTTASVCHGPSIMAIQSVGEPTSTLGEVRNRADLVIFWGADPATSHPRHFERYSVDPCGEFLPRGRADRTVVVVDTEETETARRADRFVRVAPGTDFEAIWTLRRLVRDPRGTSRESGVRHDADAEVPPDLRWLAETMVRCRYGVVFFGLGLARTGAGHLNVEALLRLVRELNDRTRFTARRLRIPGDVTGADLVLCWQTGFPFAVNLGRGYPRYEPDEFSANVLLERREVDACLFVGSEGFASLSPTAQDFLRTVPSVALDLPHRPPVGWEPTVRFVTAPYGVQAAGTAYRMDEVPIPLRKLCEPAHPTDDEVLEAIRAELGRVGQDLA